MSRAAADPVVSRPARPPLGTLRSVAALALRETATSYGRSPGGWLWAVIEPLAAIALLSFAFSLAFRAPPLGTSFALFYATGFLPYMVFHDLAQKLATAIRFSKPLFTFAAVTYVDALAARFLLNGLTHLLVSALVIGALLAMGRTGAHPEPAGIALAYAAAAALAAGAGTLNCYLFTAFPAWERLWTIAMRPMFIISGVVFLFEDVPARFQPIVAWNPLYHVTGQMRAAIYPAYDPDYLSLPYVFALAAGLAVLGLLFLNQFHDELIHK